MINLSIASLLLFLADASSSSGFNQADAFTFDTQTPTKAKTSAIKSPSINEVVSSETTSLSKPDSAAPLDLPSSQQESSPPKPKMKLTVSDMLKKGLPKERLDYKKTLPSYKFLKELDTDDDFSRETSHPTKSLINTFYTDQLADDALLEARKGKFSLLFETLEEYSISLVAAKELNCPAVLSSLKTLNAITQAIDSDKEAFEFVFDVIELLVQSHRSVSLGYTKAVEFLDMQGKEGRFKDSIHHLLDKIFYLAVNKKKKPHIRVLLSSTYSLPSKVGYWIAELADTKYSTYLDILLYLLKHADYFDIRAAKNHIEKEGIEQSAIAKKSIEEGYKRGVLSLFPSHPSKLLK